MMMMMMAGQIVASALLRARHSSGFLIATRRHVSHPWSEDREMSPFRNSQVSRTGSVPVLTRRSRTSSSFDFASNECHFAESGFQIGLSMRITARRLLLLIGTI